MLSMLPALCRARVRGLRRLSTWQVACLQTNADHPCVDSCPCFNENQPASWPAEFRVSEEVVNRYASRQPNPLRMEEVLQMKDPEETAKMLMTEMPVRLANRIAHLSHLDMMESCPALLCARARLVRSFAEVVRAADSGASLEEFANTIRAVKERHKHQVKRLTVGTHHLKRLLIQSGKSADEAIEGIDQFLDRFVLSRIGIEMLNSQYLSLFTQSRGIADPNCDPCALARKAGAIARKIAAEEFEAVPEVQVSFFGKRDARTLPLVPSYLLYILLELLKNSVRAVAENHRDNKSKEAPVDPIVIRVASDEAQVVLDIFDRGGGIPFELQQKVWSYMYSTRRGPVSADREDEATPLAGFGVGLPLSRLYAEYIGGSLQLISMPNFGTHAFLFLERCSTRKEGMPTYVNWLRKRHLLEELVELEVRKRAAAEIEDYAEALRLKGLVVEARAKLQEFNVS
mmetsp:Transcript_23654/g.56103  ORF Transcript_23654/g.56103 Transcript_23654/m.56103 type:complete len:458 (-) Transcript_23654:110-1483(-)